MTKRHNESNKLKDLIPRMLKENKLQKGMDQMTVKEAWESVMGAGVSNYTDSVSLKNEVLIVKLRSSTLREELEYGKARILEMMRASMPGINLQKIRLM